MGKGFENFMMKKDFHPANRDNQKRIWMKEQEKKITEQKEADMRAQYEREQELFRNKQLLGNEKAKLGLSFMYEPPPGARKQDLEAKEALQKQQVVKFEWQRKFNAPREEVAKGNEDIQDQPFGIEVRNVRCIKCHQWGHLNTQRICPMFGISKEDALEKQEVQAKIEEEKAKKAARRRFHNEGEPTDQKLSKNEIMEGMEEDNLRMKQNVLERVVDSEKANQKIIESEDDSMDEITFIRNLNDKEKKKLMKRFMKMQNGGEKKKKKKKQKKKSKHANDSSDSESEKKKRKKSKHQSDNEESNDIEQKPQPKTNASGSGWNKNFVNSRESKRRYSPYRGDSPTKSESLQRGRKRRSLSPKSTDKRAADQVKRREREDSQEPRRKSRKTSSSPEQHGADGGSGGRDGGRERERHQDEGIRDERRKQESGHREHGKSKQSRYKNYKNDWRTIGGLEDQ